MPKEEAILFATSNEEPLTTIVLCSLFLVSIPGFGPPPIICGYNTGQHMWVPASDSCVTITLDIDTASSAISRTWNIRVTQYDCGNLRAPEQNCLQYHTASTGNKTNMNLNIRILGD